MLGLIKKLAAACVTGRLVRDAVGVKQVPLVSSLLPGGLSCKSAPDMVVQSIQADGTLYASRGYHLYRYRDGQDCLDRDSTMPCPLGKAWMGRFAVVRDHFHRVDFVDSFQLLSGSELVFAGGFVYRRPAGQKKYKPVMKLRMWGLGIGRGIGPTGFAQLQDGRIVFGEYFRNSDHEPCHIYGSDDDGASWRIIHVLQGDSRTRHIHALQVDPFEQKLWLCTGDADDKSFIAWSDDRGETFHEIGRGSQAWRVCKLLFTETHVCWGSDTNNEHHRGFFRWSRGGGEVEKVASFGGPVLFATRLAGGTWVVGTDREGLTGMHWCYSDQQPSEPTEWDEYPSLWVSLDGLDWKRLKLERWLPEARPAFGIPQFARGDGNTYLAMTCLNIEKLNNRLFIVSEEELRRWYAEIK